MPKDAYFLFGGLFLAVASNNLLTPLLPAIRDDMRVSVASIGTFVATYGFARLLIDIPSGTLATKAGQRSVAVVGVLLNAVSSIGGALAPTFPLLILSRVGSGLGAGLLATVVLSALADIAPPAIRGRVLSLYQVANNLGIGLYPLIGGAVGSVVGWRGVFVLAAVAAVLSGVTLAPVLERVSHLPRPVAKPRTPGRRLRLQASRAVLVPLGAVYFGVVANMMNRHGFRNTVLPLFAVGHLHLTEVQTATGITLMSLTGITVALPGAALGDRVGRKRIVVTGLAMLAVGDFVFPRLATSFPTFILACMLVGMGDFFSSSQTALISDTVSPETRTAALGVYRFFVDVGALVGPALLAGVFAGGGASAAMATAGTVLALGAAVGFVGIPKRRVVA